MPWYEKHPQIIRLLPSLMILLTYSLLYLLPDLPPYAHHSVGSEEVKFGLVCNRSYSSFISFGPLQRSFTHFCCKKWFYNRSLSIQFNLHTKLLPNIAVLKRSRNDKRFKRRFSDGSCYKFSVEWPGFFMISQKNVAGRPTKSNPLIDGAVFPTVMQI